MHVKNQPLNILNLKPFLGEKNDDELYRITEFLENLAKKDDVRPVMQNYEDYMAQKDTEKKQLQRVEMLQKKLSFKFMQELKIPQRKYFDSSEGEYLDCEFDDFEEKEDADKLFQRLCTADTQDGGASSKLAKNTENDCYEPLITEKENEDKLLQELYDYPMLKESFSCATIAASELVSILKGMNCKNSRLTPRLAESTVKNLQFSGCLAEKLPVMSPKSQSMQFKKLGIGATSRR